MQIHIIVTSNLTFVSSILISEFYSNNIVLQVFEIYEINNFEEVQDGADVLLH